jgi:hypothetical protein
MQYLHLRCSAKGCDRLTLTSHGPTQPAGRDFSRRPRRIAHGSPCTRGEEESAGAGDVPGRRSGETVQREEKMAGNSNRRARQRERARRLMQRATAKLAMTILGRDRRRRIDAVIDYFGESGDAPHHSHREAPGGQARRPRVPRLDMNEYELELLVWDRIAELHADAARQQRIRAVRPASRPRRVALGQAFISMRHRLLGVRGATGPRGPIAHRESAAVRAVWPGRSIRQVRGGG